MNIIETCSMCGGDGKSFITCCGDDIKRTKYAEMNMCPSCKTLQDGADDCENCNGIGLVEVPTYTKLDDNVVKVEWEFENIEYVFEAKLVRTTKCNLHLGLWLLLNEHNSNIIRVKGAFKISDNPYIRLNQSTDINHIMGEYETLHKFEDDLDELRVIRAMDDLCKVLDLTELSFVVEGDPCKQSQLN